MKLRFLFVALIAFCLSTSTFAQKASEDIIDGEEEGDVKVEEDLADMQAKEKQPMPGASDKDLEAEEEAKAIGPSPDVETYILFTHPSNTKDFPAGAIVKFLVGFYNKGDKEFVVDNLDCSFRYPMDYTFYIQNYTAAQLDRIVPPQTEVTFDYAFVPGEGYAGRPFGLSINLHYADSNKTEFASAVFNETINVVEDESGFNPETGFLYLVFVCLIILLLVMGQQFLSKMRRKHGIMTKRPAPMEMGTSTKGDVDLDWIPKEILQMNNLSPKSGKSPRQRKANRQQENSNHH
jgi:translocon-associated protein subunit alpha